MNNPVGRPRIGVNVECKPSCNGVSEFIFLESGYVDSIIRAGGIPVVLPAIDNLDLVPQMLEGLDGCLFVGGPDLDPRFDNYMLHPSVRPMLPKREKFDRALMNEVAQRRMPVMGIGVGMQLLNVSQGGALFLHIPEDLPTALPPRDSNDDPTRPALRHALTIEKGTLLESVYGENDVRVNSRHHMAVDEVAPDFIVSARCKNDGVIEAIESAREDWFAFGVQFHPEAHSATFLDQRLFNAFINGVQSFSETGCNAFAVKPTAQPKMKRIKRSKRQFEFNMESDGFSLLM